MEREEEALDLAVNYSVVFFALRLKINCVLEVHSNLNKISRLTYSATFIYKDTRILAFARELR